MLAVSSQSQPSRVFYPVGGQYLEKMGGLTEIFNRILVPLYGPQDKALQQIRESTDRKCFLLYEDEMPAGVLAFKTVLSNEFAEFGIKNSIEIKSLFVDQSAQNSGRGLGSALVQKLKEEVEQLGVDYNSIHVTVSETKGDSLLFFTKKGFQVVHTWVGRYLKGIREHLLSCPRNAPSNVIPIDGVAQKFDKLYRSMAQEDSDLFAPELVHIVHDAHSDDIHCLKKLSDGTFVSGSKDNCLYKWNDRGERIRVVDDVEPVYRSERNWITAVEVINDEYWISGARNGELILWKTNGDYVKQIKAVLPKANNHVSHPFNYRRVTCLSAGGNVHKPSIFIGFPTMFDNYNLIEGRTENMTRVHDNDWVYAVKPLSEKSVLTVIGGNVDSWNLTDKGWVYGEKLMGEEKKYQTIIDGKRKWVRPFIADVCSLNSQNSRFGLASFNGSVQVLDITAKAVTNRWNEHKGRVWKVEKLSEHVFASSSEDGFVKLWDVRQKGSVHTIDVSSGQVTAMLALRDHVLLTGTCPEHVQNYKKSAQIRFYDLKK